MEKVLCFGLQDELQTQTEELQRRDAVVLQRNQELEEVNGQLKLGTFSTTFDSSFLFLIELEEAVEKNMSLRLWMMSTVESSKERFARPLR